MKKRTDECLFCVSRSCYERVYSAMTAHPYDEVACLFHIKQLHAHSDEALPGISKHFISSSSRMKRGVPFVESAESD